MAGAFSRCLNAKGRPDLKTSYEPDKIVNIWTCFIENGIRITDDAMVAETVLKIPVKIIEGSYDNMKITTPDDLAKAEILCKQRKNG